MSRLTLSEKNAGPTASEHAILPPVLYELEPQPNPIIPPPTHSAATRD